MYFKLNVYNPTDNEISLTVHNTHLYCVTYTSSRL